MLKIPQIIRKPKTEAKNKRLPFFYIKKVSREQYVT